MEKKTGSLKTTLVAVILSAVVITAVIISAFTVISTLNTNANQTEVYQGRLLEDIKAELKNETQVAMSICEEMNAKYEAGEMTKDEAMKQAADIIRQLRYNDGDGYFWIDTSQGVNVVLLGRDTEGQSRWDSVDPDGNHFIQDMIKNGMQQGGGYTRLMFAKPNETEPLPKINYTAYYEPFDWVLGTGVWVDYIDNLTATYTQNASAALRNNLLTTIFT